MAIRTVTAKRYGGTLVIPLTDFEHFLHKDNKYIVQDAEWNGQKCLVIIEDKGIDVKIITKPSIE